MSRDSCVLEKYNEEIIHPRGSQTCWRAVYTQGELDRLHRFCKGIGGGGCVFTGYTADNNKPPHRPACPFCTDARLPFIVLLFLLTTLVAVVAIILPVIPCSTRRAVFSPAFLEGARLLLGQHPGYQGGTAVLAVAEVVDLLGQVLPCQLAVLLSGPSLLAFDDDARRDVF